MRLVCRFQYDGKDVDLPIRQMDAGDYLGIMEEYDRRHPNHPRPTGMPTIWAKVNGKFEFWPGHDPVYTAIIDLDSQIVIREKRASQQKYKGQLSPQIPSEQDDSPNLDTGDGKALA
jgi:hypothetical protein